MEINYYGNNDWRDCCLAHFGIRGMHWGIRRFQPYSTTGPRKGGKTGKEVGLAKRVGNKISEGVKGIRTAHKRKEAAKKRAASLEKARKVKAEKEEIMKSGDAEKLLARKELFSNEDIDKFLERAGKETKVAELRQRQIDAGFQKADQIQEKVKKIAGYMGTANDLIGQGVKLKKNFDDVSELMGAKKKKAKEEEKTNLLRSGNVNEIVRRSSEFSSAELNEAYKHMVNERNIKTFNKDLGQTNASTLNKEKIKVDKNPSDKDAKNSYDKGREAAKKMFNEFDKMKKRFDSTDSKGNDEVSSGAKGVKGEEWGKRDKTTSTSQSSPKEKWVDSTVINPKVVGTPFNQPRITMNEKSSNSSSSPKPKIVDAEVVNGKAVSTNFSRPSLPGPTSSNSTPKKTSTGPLTLNPSAEARNYNKTATENLKAYSKKASDLTRQTSNIDFGEDLVRDLLSGRR